jgi:hypothetical protein
MAAKAKTQSNSVIDTAAKAIEDAAVKMQDQYFSALEQGQSAMLKGFEAVVTAMSKIDVPSIPGLDKVPGMDRVPSLDEMKVPADAFDGLFDFGAKMLDNQREFAHKMLAVSAKA